MGPQSCQGDTLELQQGLKLKQITLFMCTATHIVLTFFSLTQQNQCLSLKPSFLCYRNCMCTCQAPMCTRNGSLCKRKCIKVPQEIYKGSVTPGGHVGTRLAKTLRTDCLLYDVLHDIDVENRGERSVEARGLLAQLDLTFIGTLVIFSKVHGEAKFLADMLQSMSLDLAKAVDLVEAFQDTLQDLRSDSSFDEIWKDTVNTGKQCNVAVETVVKRPQKISSRLSRSIFLADMLQSTPIDLAKAVDLVEAFQDTLQDLRSDSSFDEIWKDTVDTGKQCNVAVETVVKRPQKMSSRLSGSIVESTVGQRRCKEGDMELFRSGIFFPILDCLSGEMQRRFSKSNCSIMKGIQALNPKSRNFLDEETIFGFARIYECDTDDIKHELHQVRRVLERKFQNGIELSSLLEFTIFFEPFKEVFYQLFCLCCIAVALPVSSASCERSFSALKLIKTHLHTTMTDDRLSNLGVLSIEVRRAKCLDLDDFVRRFASHHRNRRIQLF